LTDLKRIAKEANFNPNLLDRVARLLHAMAVIQINSIEQYDKGPNFGTFWKHDVEGLQRATRQALLTLVGQHTGQLEWRPYSIWDSNLFEFLILFFASFKGRAIPKTMIGPAFHDFTKLPKDDLIQTAQKLGLNASGVHPDRWSDWLDIKGQAALLRTLSELEWANYVEHEKREWYFPSSIGLGMLGLEPTPPAPQLSDVFQALPNLCVFAGAGLARDKLLPFFRFCVIKRIDQVFEFQLDWRRLAEAPATDSPGDALREALRELEPLPSTIARLLDTKSQLSGEIGVRFCSALLHPENAEVLAAIRAHPKLKGDLEPGAPAGYLLLNSRSDPDDFLIRCRKLGFRIKPL